jgi:hypothetical protein
VPTVPSGTPQITIRSLPALSTPPEPVGRQRCLAIRIRWCSRHSLQTQPFTYTALVPCLRSSRRVAVRAASSFSRPGFVGLAEAPDLIGSQAEVAEHLAECLAAIDRIEDLPPNGGGQPPLRSGSAKRSLCVAVSLAAEFTAAAAVPGCDVPCAASFTRGTLAGLYRPPWPDLVLAGHRFRSQSPWLDLILADGQRFGSQPWICARYRSSPGADGVIAQLEPLPGDFNQLPSIVSPEPADVIEATRLLPAPGAQNFS